MSELRITEITRAFYEQYHFPGTRPVDRDGLIFLRMFGHAMDRARRDAPTRTVRVLDAGCGTGNTSIALARQFPAVEFVGIDQSDASLENARAAAAKLGVNNVAFRQHDIMRGAVRGKRFDVVLCLGVLHHTANMKRGLTGLRRVLKHAGRLYLWIYGKHGRYSHSLNMRLLSLLRSEAGAEADPVRLVRDLLRHPGNEAMMKDLVGSLDLSAVEQRAFDDPVWIADQFLNPHEHLLDLPQVLRLVRGCGFEVERIVGMDDSVAARHLPDSLQAPFRRLSPYRQLLALDLLMKPERYFLVLTRTPLPRRA